MPARRCLVLVAIATGAIAAPAHAAWPGANGRITFDRVVHERGDIIQGDIYTVGPGGSGLAGLKTSRRTESDASWSPDGRRIAFQRAVDTSRESKTELAVMNADGSGVQVLTHNNSFVVSPSWTPDGQRILFASEFQSKQGFREQRDGPPPPLWLYSIKADGTDLRLLHRTRGGVGGRECVDPVASPVTGEIAFSCVTFGRERPNNMGIWTMNADGSSARRISENGGPDELNPAWSPDGRRFAFESTYIFGQRDVRSDIAIMNADGSRVRSIAATQWFETNPVFSPDGRKIAFTSDRSTKPRGFERLNDGFEIYTANVDGTGVRRLTTNGSADIFPDWGPAPAP